MDRTESIRELWARADRVRAAGERLALVPTMGALHEGHLSLVEAARRRADRVWLSIFVNPTQFNDPLDLERYPRTLDRDLRVCEQAGVDLVFTPAADELYPNYTPLKRCIAKSLCVMLHIYPFIIIVHHL